MGDPAPSVTFTVDDVIMATTNSSADMSMTSVTGSWITPHDFKGRKYSCVAKSFLGEAMRTSTVDFLGDDVSTDIAMTSSVTIGFSAAYTTSIPDSVVLEFTRQVNVVKLLNFYCNCGLWNRLFPMRINV